MTDTLLEQVKQSYGNEILYKCEKKYLSPHSPVKPFSNPNGLNMRGSYHSNYRYSNNHNGGRDYDRYRTDNGGHHRGENEENPFDILNQCKAMLRQTGKDERFIPQTSSSSAFPQA